MHRGIKKVTEVHPKRERFRRASIYLTISMVYRVRVEYQRFSIPSDEIDTTAAWMCFEYFGATPKNDDMSTG